MAEKAEDILELDLNEDQDADMEPLVTSKDDLWAVEDATGTDEDIIIPEQSQSINFQKARKLKNINRSDNFRRLIRRKSSKDKPNDTSEFRRNSKENEINDNNFNESLEYSSHNNGSLQPRDSVDSIDGESISLEKYLEGDIKILHHMTLYPTDEVDNESQTSEASSTNTENGINDSITNMDLLGTYLYNFTLTCLTWVWGYIETGIGYAYRYVSGDENEAVGVDRERIAEDEADTQVKEFTEKDRKRLFNICNELLTTERAYVKRLGILVKIKNKTASILQPDVARAMFQNIEVIHIFHRDNLLPQLETRIMAWNEHQKIGDIMRKLAPFLKLYTEYVKNFGAANELFESWKQKSTSFANFVKDAENSPEYGRLKVQAHMLEPVQRVPRYELLLKDYLKTLPHESEDQEDSEQALKLVSNAAKHFEDMMKRDTRILGLVQLRAQFQGDVNIVSADRELLHTEKLKLVNIKAGKISDRVLHLFNDLLLISSEEKYLLPGMADKYRVRHVFNLEYTKVTYGTNLEIPFTFYVKSPEIIVELSASSLEQRQMWIHKITKQINSCNSENGESGDTDSSLNYNETSIDDGFMMKRDTFQLSSDNKTWKKRNFSLYDNGLIGVTRTTNDKQTLACVHVANFQIGVKHSQQKRGIVMVLLGENKVYQLYDESSLLVESWHTAIKDLSSKYQTDEDQSIDDWTAIIDIKSRKSTISNLSADSGIDTVSLSSQASNVSNQST